MLPHEVAYAAFHGIRKGIARRIGKSLTLVDKFTALPKAMGGEGELSPIQKFLEIVLAARAEGGEDRAAMLLDYVLGECGRAPSVPLQAGEPLAIRAIAEATQKFADFLAENGSAYADGKLTRAEAEHLVRVIGALMAVLGREQLSLHQFIAKAEADEFRQRLGPHRVPRLLALRLATA